MTHVLDDKEWLERHAQECIDNNDAMALSHLMSNVSKSDDNALLDMVMASDRIDMADKLFERFQIKTWCEDNTERMIRTCPKVFEHWEKNGWGGSGVQVVRTIGLALDSWCDAAKESLLRGQGVGAGQWLAIRLRTRTREDVWPALSPSWVGKAGSFLRKMASQLGWRYSMLDSMVSTMFDGPTASWSDAMAYPYSLAMAARLDATLSDKLLDGFDERKVMTSPQTANPVDVALAQVLIEQGIERRVIFLHPSLVPVSSDVRQQLSNMVQVHLALGCLSDLMQALRCDCIPGYEPQKGAAPLALPELN